MDLYLVPNVRRIQTGIITERFPSSQLRDALKTKKIAALWYFTSWSCANVIFQRPFMGDAAEEETWK